MKNVRDLIMSAMMREAVTSGSKRRYVDLFIDGEMVPPEKFKKLSDKNILTEMAYFVSVYGTPEMHDYILPAGKLIREDMPHTFRLQIRRSAKRTGDQRNMVLITFVVQADKILDMYYKPDR